MRKLDRMIGATFGALILATAGVVAIAAPAQATTENCKPATLQLPVRPDSGVKGNNWAVVDITRTMETCEVGPVDGSEGLSQYKATVKDAGTFKTLAGDSPGGTVTLKRGTSGAVAGGFEATFTAPSNWAGYTPRKLKATTPTPEWVATAWTAEVKFDGSGPVANWSWTYTTCDGKGETWTNAESEPGNSKGDITGKACPTQEPTTPATPDPTAPPTVEPTTAPGTGGGGSLPVTGTAVGGIAGGAALLLAVGGVMFFVARRRKVTFTA